MTILRSPVARKGYTLLELLLALGVFAVLAAVVVPAFLGNFLHHRELDQAVASTMESILLAKRLAIQSSTPYVYEFSAGTNLDWVYPFDGPRPQPLHRIPSSIRLEADTSNSSDSCRVLFREDGTTDGFTMKVVGLHQSQRLQVTRKLAIPQRIDNERGP